MHVYIERDKEGMGEGGLKKKREWNKKGIDSREKQ